MSSLDFFFKELNYPPLDEALLSRASLPEFPYEEQLEIEKKVDETPELRRQIVETPNGRIKTAYYYNKKVVDEELINAARETLQLTGYDRKETNMVRQWVWGGDCLSAHTDENRQCQFIYILDTGGEGIQTSWYMEPGKPVARKWKRYLTCINDTRHLIKLCSVVLKPKTWYYFNTAIIHDVQNIQAMRNALCVDMPASHPLHILKPLDWK